MFTPIPCKAAKTSLPFPCDDQIEDNDKYFHSGPPFLILLHPALGPLWEVTKQKVPVQYKMLSALGSRIRRVMFLFERSYLDIMFVVGKVFTLTQYSTNSISNEILEFMIFEGNSNFGR